MIRKYEEKDLDQVIDSWYSASQVAHPFLDDEFMEQERRNLAEIYMPNAETWVYEKDGAVVGFISLSDNEVGGLFVDSRFHRQGIGRALMDKARSLHGDLELSVFKDNPVGRGFYEKYGFVQESEFFDEDTGFIQLRMVLTHK